MVGGEEEYTRLPILVYICLDVKLYYCSYNIVHTSYNPSSGNPNSVPSSYPLLIVSILQILFVQDVRTSFTVEQARVTMDAVGQCDIVTPSMGNIVGDS